MILRSDIAIRPETPRDFKDIIRLVLGSFQKGADNSDGTDVVALIEEIRISEFYIPDLSFVAEREGSVVGHFMFSRFPLSATPEGGHGSSSDIAMLAPVAVHPNFLRQGIGYTMLTLGIEEVRKRGFKGITVEGNYRFYNRLGFRTSSEYGIYPTCGIPLREPRCMMCQETHPGSMKGIGGYVVYDMYHNA